MPCQSDYLEASDAEKEASRVACLLDELNGKSYGEGDWDGYHPAVYNICTQILCDTLVAELCSRLQNVDVSKYSIRMRDWWDIHQKKDKLRQAKMQLKPIYSPKTLARAKTIQDKILRNTFPRQDGISEIIAADDLLEWLDEPLSLDKKESLILQINQARQSIVDKNIGDDGSANQYMDRVELFLNDFKRRKSGMEERHNTEKTQLIKDFSYEFGIKTHALKSNI